MNRGDLAHARRPALQLPLLCAECVSAFTLPTGIACKKPGDPAEHPDGYHEESNGHPLKTAHRSPVHLHAVREEPILFRAPRSHRGARRVHGGLLCIGVRRTEGASHALGFGSRAKGAQRTAGLLAKLAHVCLLRGIVEGQRARRPSTLACGSPP